MYIRDIAEAAHHANMPIGNGGISGSDAVTSKAIKYL